MGWDYRIETLNIKAYIVYFNFILHFFHPKPSIGVKVSSHSSHIPIHCILESSKWLMFLHWGHALDTWMETHSMYPAIELLVLFGFVFLFLLFGHCCFHFLHILVPFHDCQNFDSVRTSVDCILVEQGGKKASAGKLLFEILVWVGILAYLVVLGAFVGKKLYLGSGFGLGHIVERHIFNDWC